MTEEKPIRSILTFPIIQGQLTFIGATTQTTVGAAGGATVLPATPKGYIKFVSDNVEYVIPFYTAV